MNEKDAIRIKEEKFRLPVDVRGSKRSVLKLPIIFLPALSSRTVYSLLLHLDPREKISPPIQDLFCSRKPITYPGSASVQCGLYGITDYPLSQALTFFTQTSVSYWNSDLSNEYKFIYVPR